PTPRASSQARAPPSSTRSSVDQLLANAGDWLHLIVRWLHVTAAIAWVGASFYFIALDQSLRPPKRDGAEAEGVGGAALKLHGGGFYRVEKYRVAPRTLPAPLAWFKWEAYTTWLSGFALLIVLYYANATTYLIDRAVADISPAVAIAISVAILLVGWFVYDGLCRLFVNNDRMLAAALAVLIVAVAYGTS